MVYVTIGGFAGGYTRFTHCSPRRLRIGNVVPAVYTDKIGEWEGCSIFLSQMRRLINSRQSLPPSVHVF